MNLCASGALCTASCSIAPSSRGIATYSTTTTALKIFANNARSCSRVADYPTDELLQLHSAVRFLRNIFVNVSGIRMFCAIFCILRVGADAVPRDSSPALPVPLVPCAHGTRARSVSLKTISTSSRSRTTDRIPFSWDTSAFRLTMSGPHATSYPEGR